jgi:cytochrome c oxidase subunit 2
MKLDVTRLPMGEFLVAFVLAAVVATFILAFAFGPGTGIEGGQAEEEVAAEPWERGQEIANSFGCAGCHTTTGVVTQGPSWLDLFGTTVTLSDGAQVLVDEAYVQESILDPSIKLVQGFDAVMPTFSTLTDQDIQDVIAYMQSVSENTPAATPAAEASPTQTPTP